MPSLQSEPSATSPPQSLRVAIQEADDATKGTDMSAEPQVEISEDPSRKEEEAPEVPVDEVPSTDISTGNPGNETSLPRIEITEPIDWKTRVLGLPLLVSVGEFDFEDFKNRWGEDARYHVIELLMGSDRSLEEKNREELQRDGKYGEKGQRQDAKAKGSTSDRWIQRIRIHSPSILSHLKEGMNPPNWSTEQPRVFFRPFKALIHYHEHMKKSLEDLERKCVGMRPLETENSRINPPQTSIVDQTAQEAAMNEVTLAVNVASVNDTRESPGSTDLEHLRCYVKFMDERIIPMENMFNGTDQRMVRFDELWHLFKIGDIIYSPSSIRLKEPGGLRAPKGRYQTAFKLYFKGVSVIDDSYPDDLETKDRTMALWCYYLDYNGESYGPVKQRIIIEAFSGKKDIRELPAYPIRFAANSEKIQEDLKLQGKRFRSFTKERHVSCEGWTIAGPPLGEFDKEKEDSETPEHVEGDVIIDFQETLRRKPSWKPEFEAPYEETTEDWKYGKDAMSINHWSTSSEPGKPKEPLFSIQEFTQRDDDTEEKLKMAGISRDALLKAYKEGDVASLNGLDEETNDLLLPRRFFVYVLRQRRFAMIDTFSLNAIPPQSTIFDELQIDMNHKLIVQSLVAAHFEKRKVQRHRPVLGPIDQDLVRGKGSGLFILLHGVPGVGKTATAEAVAQANNKPLFSITCGDLGLTPEAIDSKLNEVFRLAHLWDCVLLLDEADVFLARRDTHNLQRNALVSVEIFRVNIKRLRGIEEEKQCQLEGTELEQPRLRIMGKSIIEYAQRYYDEQEDTPHLRWNGRQIRNAFQIASSLAHYNMNKASLSTDNFQSGQLASPVLDEKQFENVAVAIEQFGNYMDYTKAMTDADQARLETTRADHMRNEDLTSRRRDHFRRQDQVAKHNLGPPQFRQAPQRDQMSGNSRGEDRRRPRDQMPPGRATHHREGGAAGQQQVPVRNPRLRTPTASQDGSSRSSKAPTQSQRHEQRPRYDFNEGYGEEDQCIDQRDFRVYDRESRNRVGDDRFEDDDYDDYDEAVNGGAREKSSQADELDYDD
ncbi:aaa family ATPase [Fusarium austroafricanum]|uniref:Aaa family ATPase n=1 Tax=Fusarium austroafricanum TaxID=2364996 RepID=A0A8H4K5X6_9HYPO|nr:aaa family ATPase [Fusarium austroafricanum]